jgi:undecaprenyl-diphosphatase
VAIAFVTTAVPALLLKKRIEGNLEHLWVMGTALLVGGVVMWVVDALCTRPKITHVEQMSVIDALWIGAWQITSAVFPGTSRSMSTIAAGQVFGMSRAAALEFSFFLSIPIMVAATLKELKDVILPARDPATGIRPPGLHPTGEQWTALAIGTAVSFVVAWVVIAWFMGWVRRRGFTPFAVYRIALGLGLLAWSASKGWL